MYTNNLVIDYENIINIPQNLDRYFIINKSEVIKNSIKIKIEPFEEINILNLYLIIKSYSSSIIYVPSNLFIVIKNKNQSEFIVWNSNISEIKNLSYYGFIKWFYDQLHNDWKYIKEDGDYSFIITYPIEVFDKTLLDFLKPKFPWDSSILEKLTKLKENEEYYLNTIEKQKKEIEELKKKLEDFKNK